MRRRKIYGWGYEDEILTPEENQELGDKWGGYFGTENFDPIPAPTLEEIELRKPRISPPKSLEAICSTEHYDRAFHSYGTSLRDVLTVLEAEG